MNQPNHHRMPTRQPVSRQRRSWRIRLMVAGFVIWLGLSNAVTPTWSQEAPPPGTQPGDVSEDSLEQTIEYWVSQLGHEHYLRRELASAKLVATGPAAVDQLAEAIRSGDLEVVERAAAALVEIASVSPPRRDGGAYTRLSTIADQSVGRSASVARDAVRDVRMQRHVLARQTLAGAGIAVGVRELAIGALAQQRMLLQIDENWNGDTEPLQWLAWLDRIEYARVIGPAITPEVINNVAQMPGLRSLALVDSTIENAALEPLTKMDRIDTLDIRYVKLTEQQGDLIAAIPLRVSLNLMGTGLPPEKVDAMRSALPGLKIEYRRGGFLGVTCFDNFDSCIINSVEPGGAAKDAGLIQHDVIVQIDDSPVEHFRDLQSAIGRHVAGDEVEVRYRRGDKIESVKLRLRRYEDK